MRDPFETKERIARISVEAERLAAAGKGPSDLVAAVLKDGEAELAALAAERHHHAAMIRLEEAHRATLAERSPVFSIDARTLVAAPVGAMGADGLSRFVDRVLGAAAMQKPSRVVLVLQGFAAHPGADAALDELSRELAAQGAALERR